MWCHEFWDRAILKVQPTPGIMRVSCNLGRCSGIKSYFYQLWPRIPKWLQETMLISWLLPCLLIIDPMFMRRRRYYGVLCEGTEGTESPVLWPSRNFVTTEVMCQTRHRYEWAPGVLTNHILSAWYMKTCCLLELWSQVLPLETKHWHFKLCSLFQPFIWHIKS